MTVFIKLCWKHIVPCIVCGILIHPDELWSLKKKIKNHPAGLLPVVLRRRQPVPSTPLQQTARNVTAGVYYVLRFTAPNTELHPA